MKPEQLIDQLADAIGVPRTASKMTFTRDWRIGELKVTVEFQPSTVAKDTAANIALRIPDALHVFRRLRPSFGIAAADVGWKPRRANAEISTLMRNRFDYAEIEEQSVRKRGERAPVACAD
jgi:hypothetical protein